MPGFTGPAAIALARQNAAARGRLMRLSATDLACVRGGRAGLCRRRLSRRRRRGAAGDRAQRRRQIVAAAAGRRAGAAGRRAVCARRRRPGADHRRAGALSRPPGRAEAGADGARKISTSGRASWAARRRPRRRGARRGRARRGSRRPARRPISRPGSGGGSRSPGCSRSPRPLWLLDEPTSALDAAAQATAARR